MKKNPKFIILVSPLFLFLFILFSNTANAQKYPIETMVQTGHSAIPFNICISADSKYLLSVAGKKAILWDMSNGKQIRIFSDHVKGGANMVIFYDDDKYVGLANGVYHKNLSKKTVTYSLFEIATGKYIGKKDIHFQWRSYSPDGEHRITDYQMKFLDLPAINRTTYVEGRNHTDTIYLISGTTPWINLHRKFIGHKDGIRSKCFSSDAKMILSGSEDSTAICWNAATGEILYRFTEQKAPITYVGFSPDNRYAITAAMDGSVIVWDLNNGSLFRHFKSLIPPIGSVDYNEADNSILASSNKPMVWDLNRMTILYDLDLKTDVLNDPRLRLMGDNMLPVNSSFYKKLSGRTASSYGWKTYFDSKFSLDNKKIYTGSFSNKINVWDAQSGEKLRTIQLSKKMVYSLDFSPDGKYLVAGLYDNKVVVYDLINDSIRATIPNGRLHVYSVAYSHDGKKIAYASDGTSWVRIINTETYEREKAFDTKYGSPTFVDFSQDDKLLLASGEDIYATNYNFENKELKKLPYKHKAGLKCGKFYDNDRYVFTSSYDKTIIQCDLKKKKMVHLYKGHNGNVNTISFIKEKNYLISGSNDGTVKIWDIESGDLLLTLIGKSKDNYIVFTPDNYYLSSKSANTGIHFVQGMKTYGFEQFDLKYNRPDIVLSRLGFADSSLIEAYHKAYLKRLKKMNFTEDMLKDDLHLPEIKIENFEEMPTITESPSVSLKIEAKDSKYKLDRINVWVNDVAVYGTNGISLRDQNLSSYQTDLKVNLVKGKNKVQVSVLNQAGVESYKETFEINCKAGKVKPDLYLITIGDSKYKDAQFNLSYAAKDAKDVAALFANSQVYEKVITKTLTNEQVTKANIQELKAFLAQAGINDEVMIFIAGHGVLDENLDYFFASYDMDFNNPSQRGVAYEDLEGLLDGIKPLKKVLLIDACHSGEIDKEEVELLAVNEEVGAEGIQFRTIGNTVKPKLGMQNTSELTKALFTDLRKGTGATVISSAGGGEYAMESGEWKNGLFTYCLLKGIETKEADLNGDGEIWLKELQEYVQTQVTELSGGKQQPTSRIENSVLDYRVW